MARMLSARRARPERLVTPRTRLAGARLTRMRLALLGAASVVVASVVRFPRPNYVLDPVYTDHLQHEYSAWAFLHIGLRIFDTPKSDWGNVHAAHVHLLWEQVPAVYPPGLIAFFMPFGVASNEQLLADERVHMLMVMVLGVGAVLASFQLVRSLRLAYEPVLTAILAVLGTVLFVTAGLDGFIDPLAAGLALAGIYWAERGAPGRGVVVLALGLSLQYRLWYLWPLVVAIVIEHRREIGRRRLAAAAAVAAASLVTFALSVPSVSEFDDIPNIGPNPLALTHGVDAVQAAALVAGCLVVAVTLLYDRAVTAACVALALLLVFAVDQWEVWYPVLFVPLLVVPRARPAQVAVTLAFLEGMVYLGGFPNALRFVHLYTQAVG
jgi:hypothetical protein